MPDPVQRDYVLSVAALTDVGQSRGHNEDYVGHYEPPDEQAMRSAGALFVVCDGVGGGSAGEVASEHAVRRILSDYYQPGNQGTPQERLIAAIHRANSDIYDENLRRGEDKRMATTVVAALLLGRQLLLAHAGDSRAYVIREGKAFQLTQDHSWVAEMVQSGDLSPQEAANHPWRNRITRSLGMGESVKIDSKAIQVQPGDTFLLCSDGLTRYVSDEELAEAAKLPAQQAAQQLIAQANSRGGSDNISAVIVELLAESVARQREALAEVAAPTASAQPVSPAPAAAPEPRSGRRRGLVIAASAGGALIVLAVAVVATGSLMRSSRGSIAPTALAAEPTAASTSLAVAVEGTATLEPIATATEERLPVPTEMEALATLLPLETLLPTTEPTVVGDSGTVASPTQSEQTNPIEGLVIAPIGVKLREEPSLAGELIVVLPEGDAFEVRGWVGRAADLCKSGLWLRAFLPSEDVTGWLCADESLVEINGQPVSPELLAELGVPQVQPTPTPKAKPSNTPEVVFRPGPEFRLVLAQARAFASTWLGEGSSSFGAGVALVAALRSTSLALPAADGLRIGCLPGLGVGEVTLHLGGNVALPSPDGSPLPELDLPPLPDLGL